MAAGATERVVTDRLTGAALAGFDPVAYFSDQEARSGDPAIEATQAGVIWRFRSVSNRDYFLARPDIYAPQFGGYDPIDVARGAPVAGDPRIWLVASNRLYLFASAAHRDRFKASPETAAKQASARWPSLADQLAE